MRQRLLWVSLCLAWCVLAGTAGQGHAAMYYLSPSGNNGNAGTSSGAPWLTFTFALPLLVPGDTLLLLDGTYTTANSGLPQIICGGATDHGTASQRITLKALNERKAHISSNGTIHALEMITCNYWTIEGLHLSGNDHTASGKDVMRLYESNQLIIRRNLVHNNNRYHNTHCLINEHGDYNLFEENEIYNCHRHGLTQWGSTPETTPVGNIVRRNYVNSRDFPDLPGGYAPGDRPDEGIACYPCNTTIFENNIAERFTGGYTIQAKFSTLNNQYLGNIALNNNLGLIFRARLDNPPFTADDMPQNTVVRDTLVSWSVHVGVYLRANKNTQIFNMTAINAVGSPGSGLITDIEVGNPGDGNPSLFGENILIANNPGSGVSINQYPTWGINEIMLYNNAGGNNPALTDSHFSNVSTANPVLGTCMIVIPTGSPAKGAGVGGADIGANILYRYQNGVLTTTPLWNPTTSQFPCGAKIAGFNDLAGYSCFDVHQRLNVNFNGCTLPGESPPPDPPPPGDGTFPPRAPMMLRQVPGLAKGLGLIPF